MLNWEVMMICLIAGLIKKWVNYPEPGGPGRNKRNVTFTLLCKKIWHKKVTGVVTLEFTKKTESKVDKLNVDKIETVLTDLNELSEVVDNVVKKTFYEKWLENVNIVDGIDTSKLVKNLTMQ